MGIQTALTIIQILKFVFIISLVTLIYFLIDFILFMKNFKNEEKILYFFEDNEKQIMDIVNGENYLEKYEDINEIIAVVTYDMIKYEYPQIKYKEVYEVLNYEFKYNKKDSRIN